MKNIQNRSLRHSLLNVKGAEYTGDHAGVFEMEDAHADLLLGTPGWSNSARGPEAPPAASAFDPIAAMARNDAAPDPAGAADLEAAQAALDNALGDVTRLETRLQTSEALRADLQTAVHSKDAALAELRASTSKEIATLRAAAAVPAAPEASAPVPPAPGATSAPATEQKEGPDLASMDKTALLAAAEKWEVELTAAQKKLGEDKLRAVVDKAIYAPNE